MKGGGAGKTLVLDGYNVIHLVPELEKLLELSLESAREGLIAYAERFRASRGDIRRMVIVFDGRDPWDGGETRRSGAEIIFSGSGETADDRILAMVEEGRPGEFVVVSSDNGVANNAKANAAEAVRVPEFRVLAGKKSGKLAAGKPKVSDQEARSITEEYKRHLGLS